MVPPVSTLDSSQDSMLTRGELIIKGEPSGVAKLWALDLRSSGDSLFSWLKANESALDEV